MAVSHAVEFADLLKRYRVAIGLTQEELAERAGLSAKGIRNLERGARTRPRLGTGMLLADALGLIEPDPTALLTAARPQSAPHASIETARSRAALPDPLLATKLYRPRPRTGLVDSAR